MTTKTPKEMTIEEIAERITMRMDGRTVTSHEHYREMLKEELRHAITKYRQDILAVLAKEVQSRLEKYEDKSDERYGFAKHNNTILQRIEDDILTLLQETLGEGKEI